MVEITIDGNVYEAEEGATILEVAREHRVDIPTLCYLHEINEIGACRVCLVEVEGIDHLVAACNNEVTDGMVVYTDTPRVRRARVANLQLILRGTIAAAPRASATEPASCKRLPTAWASTRCPIPRSSRPSPSTRGSRSCASPRNA